MQLRHLKFYLAMGFILLTCSSALYAESGSASKSCAGYMTICTDYCRKEYFHIYTYQYVYIYNHKIESENHVLNLSGVLGNGSDYVMQPFADGNHVIYISPRITLAVPFKSGESIKAHFNREYPYDWQTLCS